MNHINLKLPQTAFAAFLALATLALSGCITDDAMNDDGIRNPYQSPVAYPLQAMRGKGDKCGNWPEDLTETSQNTAYVNHGCAVQANIAAEIADPSTLYRPHATDLPLGANAAAAVRNMNTTAAATTSLSTSATSSASP
jgi:type IV pilus biogenesis protein CpaD/CtpE